MKHADSPATTSSRQPVRKHTIMWAEPERFFCGGIFKSVPASFTERLFFSDALLLEGIWQVCDNPNAKRYTKQILNRAVIIPRCQNSSTQNKSNSFTEKLKEKKNNFVKWFNVGDWVPLLWYPKRLDTKAIWKWKERLYICFILSVKLLTFWRWIVWLQKWIYIFMPEYMFFSSLSEFFNYKNCHGKQAGLYTYYESHVKCQHLSLSNKH